MNATRPGNRTDVVPRKIAVIGAGIVGVSAALYLQRDGHQVTIFDPREPGGGASYGNAGVIAVASCTPIVLPGILKRIPRMLLDSDGPVRLRWRYLLTIAPWLTQLVLATRPAKVDRTSQVLAGLLAGACGAYEQLLRLTGAQELVRPVGRLTVYATEEGYRHAAAARELAARCGVKADLLNEDEIRQLEPDLAPIFRRGIFNPNNSFVLNPKKMISRFAEAFVQAGGQIIRQSVNDIRRTGGRWQIATDGQAYDTHTVVISAGAWSRSLCDALHIRIPLDTERGYHLMLPHSGVSLGRPVLWGEHYLNLCPMEEGIRMTAGVEFAGLDAPADYRRIRRLLPLAQQMLPELTTSPTSEWLGFRPSLPDSLPVLGRAPVHDDIVLAFGHQHLGLTLGPVSGRIVADLVAGRDPGADLTPFRASRSFWR